MGANRILLQIVSTLGPLYLILFAAAGRSDFWQAWVLVLGSILIGILTAQVFSRGAPFVRRKSGEGPKPPLWDLILLPVYGLFLVSLFLTAGLDARFHWSPSIAPVFYGAAWAFDLAGAILIFWSLWSNPFFEITARIQEEQGQEPVMRGPYRFVRHPGYAGMAFLWAGLPISLGSWCAFGPAAACILILVIRTILEDRMLKKGLPGYAAYAGRVTDRWLPGIW